VLPAISQPNTTHQEPVLFTLHNRPRTRALINVKPAKQSLQKSTITTFSNSAHQAVAFKTLIQLTNTKTHPTASISQTTIILPISP
jgi:hypothetical protein